MKKLYTEFAAFMGEGEKYDEVPENTFHKYKDIFMGTKDQEDIIPQIWREYGLRIYKNGLFQFALYLLDSIEDVEENEFYLNILLQALRDRNQLDAFEDIAAKALLSDGAEDKLYYTECLISIERESTLPLLIQAAAEKKVIVS